MELNIHNIKGVKTGKKVKLDSSVFGVEPNNHAIYLDVKSYLANKRQGTHKSRQRADIKGSTRKIKKQKGTGTARAGSIKNPLYRGGGRIFGPVPRDYTQKVNRKVKRLARKSALSIKAKQKSIFLIEDFQMEKPSTKDFTRILTALGLSGKKNLFVLEEWNKNVYLSSRNLKNSSVVINSELNTYGISNANNLIISEGAIPQIESLLNR